MADCVPPVIFSENEYASKIEICAMCDRTQSWIKTKIRVHFIWRLNGNWRITDTHTKKTYIKSDKIYWMYMNGYHGCWFAYIMLLSCALWLHSEALIVTLTTYLRLFIFDVSSRSIAHKLDAISGSPHRIPIPRNEDNSAILYVDKNIALFFFHSTIYD